MNNAYMYFISGIFVALSLSILHSVLGAVHWWSFSGYVIVGFGLVFFSWGAERIWWNTIGAMFHRPFSMMAYMSRAPFWFIAGGIGYTLGMLLAKKFSLMGFYDIPVKPLFMLGGKIGVIFQILMQVLLRYAKTESIQREKLFNR